MFLVCLIVALLLGIVAWTAVTAPNAPLPPQRDDGERG
jgi:hypothetical protein